MKGVCERVGKAVSSVSKKAQEAGLKLTCDQAFPFSLVSQTKTEEGRLITDRLS